MTHVLPVAIQNISQIYIHRHQILYLSPEPLMSTSMAASFFPSGGYSPVHGRDRGPAPPSSWRHSMPPGMHPGMQVPPNYQDLYNPWVCSIPCLFTLFLTNTCTSSKGRILLPRSSRLRLNVSPSPTSSPNPRRPTPAGPNLHVLHPDSPTCPPNKPLDASHQSNQLHWRRRL